MAMQETREVYSNAMIDCLDMTLTKYGPDDIRSYDIAEILKRWDGVKDIRIVISGTRPLPPDGK